MVSDIKVIKDCIHSLTEASFSWLNADKLQTQTLVRPQSCGPTAKEGDRLTVHYAGYFTNTVKFDSRYGIPIFQWLSLFVRPPVLSEIYFI